LEVVELVLQVVEPKS